MRKGSEDERKDNPLSVAQIKKKYFYRFLRPYVAVNIENSIQHFIGVLHFTSHTYCTILRNPFLPKRRRDYNDFSRKHATSYTPIGAASYLRSYEQQAQSSRRSGQLQHVVVDEEEVAI